MIPKPRFLQKRIGEVAIGTFKQIATVQESASVYEALMIFVERRVSALPVVNEQSTQTFYRPEEWGIFIFFVKSVFKQCHNFQVINLLIMILI